MILSVNSKDYSFRFGVGFIRRMDERYQMKENGVSFGASMETRVPMLLAKDTAALAEILFIANQTETPRLSQNDVDDFIDNADNIEAVFDEVIDELKKSNATKLKMKSLIETLKQAQ